MNVSHPPISRRKLLRGIAIASAGVLAAGGLASFSPASAAGYNYVFSTFHSDAVSGEKLSIFTSGDGLTFSLFSNTGYGGSTGVLRDPSITRQPNGTYYIAYTTESWTTASNSFGIASSSDLIHWTLVTTVTSAVANTHFVWAPEWFKDSDGSLNILVSTNQYGVHSIDPAVFIDSNNQPYLIFGNGGARLGKLNTDMTSFSGTPVNITPSGASYREAPYMFKRDGAYYLTWSQNDTRQTTYQVSYAKASSITGPFVAASGNPILSENTSLGILGTGSASIWGASTGQYYIVYHRFAIPNGDGYHRVVAIDPLNFNTNGTIQHVAVSLTGLQSAVSPSPNNPPAF